MYKSCVRGAMAGLFLAHALSAAAQSAAIDIKDLRPREIRSTVFRLSAPQELRIMAVGAEADTRRGTFGWVTAMWDTNGETTYTRGSDKTTRALGTWAVRNAILDAGLNASDIDGMLDY